MEEMEGAQTEGVEEVEEGLVGVGEEEEEEAEAEMHGIDTVSKRLLMKCKVSPIGFLCLSGFRAKHLHHRAQTCSGTCATR